MIPPRGARYPPRFHAIGFEPREEAIDDEGYMPYEMMLPGICKNPRFEMFRLFVEKIARDIRS